MTKTIKFYPQQGQLRAVTVLRHDDHGADAPYEVIWQARYGVAWTCVRTKREALALAESKR